MPTTPPTSLRRAVFRLLDLAFSGEHGRNEGDRARVLAKIVRLLAAHEARIGSRRRASADASLVFDVVAAVYGRVESGELESEEEVRRALRQRGSTLGFELDEDSLNDFVALRDEFAGRGGAVDAAVTAFAARQGRSKRAVYKRLGPASAKLLRKKGLLSATPPSRMTAWSGDLVNLGLYSLDVLAEIATDKGAQRAVEPLRRARSALLTEFGGTAGAGVAPPPPPPSRRPVGRGRAAGRTKRRSNG
jgi:hypothetical protein